jgi:putative PIN family toxin of toxin-antitoxin system
MAREPRVVIDTNVLVSFLLRRGSTPWRVVRDVLECGELLVSDDTLAELEEVLRRTKFDRYVSRAVREQFLTTLPESSRRTSRSSSGSKRARTLRMTRSSKQLSMAMPLSWSPVTGLCWP